MRLTHCLFAAFSAALVFSGAASAFCGFYVARADSKLYNQSSQVVLVRDDDRTVITMSNDFRGDVEDFAMVIPVPTFIKREQIHVADRALLDHLDAYTAPRLVEYFDEDPCIVMRRLEMAPQAAGMPDALPSEMEAARDYGVTIEASYTVGEYDILILSAEQSDGLIAWLKDNGYRIPDGAGPVVKSYLKQDMRFFVAKVNLEEQSKLGFNKLRPIQVAYESPKFMLPIRLGMVNADGAQELFVYALTRSGRVETTNYRTVRLPSNAQVPEFIKNDFGNFYQTMFQHQTVRHQHRAVFLEYAWDMAWCDPCAADPMSAKQLRELGVFWVPDAKQQAQDVFVTRLHVRYDRQHFPEDLVFQETGDRSNYQGRYIIRHPWSGEARCQAAEHYLQKELPARREQEARTVAELTGWSLAFVNERIPDLPGVEPRR